MSNVPARHQGPRRHAAVEIIVNGDKITSKLFPYLISVQVIDTLNEHDQCNIELDDRDAQLQIPPDGAKLQVAMGWAGEGPRLPDIGRTSNSGRFGQGPIQMTEQEKTELPWGGPGLELVFSGWVSSVESGFGRRGGGRRLWIEATSGNVTGAAKEVQKYGAGVGVEDDSLYGGQGGLVSPTGGATSTSGGAAGAPAGGFPAGEIPLFQVLTEMFAKAGIRVKLSPAMMKIARKNWNTNQSPMDFAQSMARELGGSFKLADGVATMVGKGEGLNADGEKMPEVDAQWGVNLIGWRIKPYSGRPQYAQSQANVFNLFTGEWEAVKSTIAGLTPFGGSKAIAVAIGAVADKTVAAQVNTGQGEDSTSKRGTGWVLINGEPLCKAGGHVSIIDARPGVDGRYLVVESEHNYTRGVGYTTRMNVQYPQPKVGGYAWNRDPGQFDPNATPPPQIAPPEPTPPKGNWSGEYVPLLPNRSKPLPWWFGGESEEARRLRQTPPGFSEVEKERMRNWYRERKLDLPPELTQ